MDLVREILISPAGSFGFVFALLAAVFYGVHYVTKFFTMMKTEHSHFKENVDGIRGNVDEIRKDLAYMKGSIDIIRKSNPDGLTQRNSPISLTDKGKEIAENQGLINIVANNWDKIYSQISVDLTSMNPYDIQEYCIETASVDLNKFLKTEDIEKIKTLAFSNGYPLMSYTNIIGVIIRDKYFEIKGIDVSDVDKYDPTIPIIR